jgi:hypothetical protein
MVNAFVGFSFTLKNAWAKIQKKKERSIVGG